jgi:glycosyltransferase involved in cell wall biosynthesis
MKILIATGIYPPDLGGPATYSKLLKEGLPHSGICVEVLSFGEVRHLPKIIRHIMFFLKVIIRSRGSNIVFAQDTLSVGLPSILATKLMRKRFVIRVPGDYVWEQSVQRFGVKDSIDVFQNKRYSRKIEIARTIQKFVVRRADAVIAPSEYFARLVDGWIDRGDGVTKVIYNGIDLSEIDKICTQNFSRNKKMILSAGRLVPWKGFEEIIKLMRHLPEYSLEIAGDGPLWNKLQKLIEENGLSDRVRLLGMIERKELLKRKAEAQFFVLNTSFESFSFDIVEAMAVGTPVIATNIGNLSEIIDNEINGILVNQDTTSDIVSIVKRLSIDGSLYQMISNNAKIKAKEFSIQTTIESTAVVLKSVSNESHI